jgi:hypothetical protein
MVDQVTVQEKADIKRTRARPKTLKFDKAEIAKRVIQFADDDMYARTDFMEARLQRYAKFRNWVERDTGPWQDSSDVALPDMMTHSTKLQDILVNAIMSSQPPISAMARNKADVAKESTIDDLIQHQLFVDMKGTVLIGDLVECFVNDGVFTTHIPWVQERRDIIDIRTFPAIPDELLPRQYFIAKIREEFPQALVQSVGNSDWDFNVEDGKEVFLARFYTTDEDKVELFMEREVEVFNGPRPSVKDIDEVLHPWRAANLQMPGPSNPGGAAHVVLVDYPTIDEIRRLKKAGHYDLITEEQLESLDQFARTRVNEEFKDQKDALQGTEEVDERDASHKTLTRYICYDVWDGKDVIWYVLREGEIMLKAAHLTEIYPANPPRRPFAEATFLPVKGRRLSISYLEQMEGLHDASKELFDQMIDAGTLSNSPFFFYKANAQNPDAIRLGPGDGMPMTNPREDIFFPNIQNNQTFGINAYSILEGLQGRVTLTNDLNFGGVPQGGSSALRTEGNMQLVLGQSESRPERIIRRLFEGLAEMYHQIHELNQRYLPDDKKILKSGNLDQDADPYQTIKDISEIQGRMEFKFSANVLNTSKSGMQQAMNAITGLLASELMIQTGIVSPEQLYNIAEETIKALGQDPRKFIKKPTPDSGLMKYFAEEAILQIMNNSKPVGRPAEAGGATEHLQYLIQFTESDNFGHLTEKQVGEFKAYLERIQAMAQQEAQLQQQAAAAGSRGQARSAPAGPGPNSEVIKAMQPQQLSNNETFAPQPGEPGA